MWGGGLARVYHLCVCRGSGTSVPLVCVCVWGGGWHECTTCVYVCVCVWGGGAGTSVPLVCVWGVARSHHCLTATVDRGTVTLVSLSGCSGSGLRFPLYHGSPCTMVPLAPWFPCTTVPIVPWFPLYHGSPVPRLTRHWVTE